MIWLIPQEPVNGDGTCSREVNAALFEEHGCEEKEYMRGGECRRTVKTHPRERNEAVKVRGTLLGAKKGEQTAQ